MGIRREDISKFCEILNIPFSMSKDTWHSHEDALLQAHTEVVQVGLEKNRKEARKLAMADEEISEEDEDTLVDIPISFDGTWSKRGYTGISVNSLVKIRCPKHKWHGRKRIELATASATLHFSAGATAKYEVMVRAGLVVGAGTRKKSRRDSGRMKKAEKRIQDQRKKYRVARRQAKQRDEEQW
ncbi:unnamed protein product [Porites evermanni]|uniref:Mutator-like transposase domain-containing protein n=1 Tax=Porites evermanni TaxID=104178 RepID=A0ABN8LQC6_9CNID|nr:unnamed protein product [Porites evermanni]